MIYIKRAVSADVTRQIDLSFEVAEVFFGYNPSVTGLVLDVEFCEKHSRDIYKGRIKKSGHSVTIPGELFSYIKANHKIDDLIVFESTNNPKKFLFQVLRSSDKQYQEYEGLLSKYGKFSRAIRKYTHLLIDETTIPEGHWMKVINDWIEKIEALEGKEDRLSESVVRELHEEWKMLLAQNMMNLVKKGTDVVCPFTGVEGDFSKFPMLFIASHIKRFADSSLKEKYDINNGLLLTANADALFDKYMITVSEDKKLVFSKFIDEDLKKILNLVEITLPDVLNDERMEYMKEHRRIFLEKEQIRETLGRYEEDAYTTNDSSDVVNKNSALRPIADPTESEYVSMAADDSDFYGSLSKKEVFRNKKEDFIMGCYKNSKHAKWIDNHRMYNIRLGNRSGAYDPKELPTSCVLILYQKSRLANNRAFRVTNGREMSCQELLSFDYPGTLKETYYFVYDIVEDIDIKYDIESLFETAKQKLGDKFKNGMPLIIK